MTGSLPAWAELASLPVLFQGKSEAHLPVFSIKMLLFVVQVKMCLYEFLRSVQRSLRESDVLFFGEHCYCAPVALPASSRLKHSLWKSSWTERFQLNLSCSVRSSRCSVLTSFIQELGESLQSSPVINTLQKAFSIHRLIIQLIIISRIVSWLTVMSAEKKMTGSEDKCVGNVFIRGENDHLCIWTFFKALFLPQPVIAVSAYSHINFNSKKMHWPGISLSFIVKASRMKKPFSLSPPVSNFSLN